MFGCPCGRSIALCTIRRRRIRRGIGEDKVGRGEEEIGTGSYHNSTHIGNIPVGGVAVDFRVECLNVSLLCKIL